MSHRPTFDITLLLTIAGAIASAQMPPIPSAPVPAKPVVHAKPLLSPKAASLVSGSVMAVPGKLQLPVHSEPKHYGAVVLVWRSDYKGMTNVQTVVESSSGETIGYIWQEKFRLPSDVESVTNQITTNAEIFRAYSDFKK